VSDRWCHHIAERFVSSSLQEDFSPFAYPGSPSSASSADDIPTLIEAILATLPAGLPWLLHSTRATPDQASPILVKHWESVVVLQQIMIQRMTVDTPGMSEIAAFPCASTIVRSPWLHLWESVQAVQGNFQLSVGQFVQQSDCDPGIPHLSGVLCACWWGTQGLPLVWLTALTYPTPAQREWLQKRWQITSLDTVEAWSEKLWRQWIGQYDALSSTIIARSS
jgi:hypothetical protein